MDDEAALRAARVANAAAAWLRAPVDTTAYARLVVAVEQWDAYRSPALEPGVAEELLDELADRNPPQPLGDLPPHLDAALRRRARREL